MNPDSQCVNFVFWVTRKFIFKHEIKKKMDSAVKELEREVTYIQLLKDMENAAFPLFWKVTVIDAGPSGGAF